LLGLLATCSSKEESLYAIQLVGPREAFMTASTVVLYRSDQEIARSTVNAQGGFTLEVSGVNPDDTAGSAIFVVRGLNAQNQLVAYGETPQLEVSPAAQDLKIFVQPPGTVAYSTDFPVKLRNQTVLAAVTRPTTSVRLEMTAPIFAHGESVVTQNGVETTTFSSALYVYNPLSHVVEKVTDLPRAASEVVGIARLDQAVFLFGGFRPEPPAVGPTPGMKASQRLDLMVVGREKFKSFTMPVEPVSVLDSDGMTARAGAAVAQAGTLRLMFGGINDYEVRAPIATVAALDESTTQMFTVRRHKDMIAARYGHTATTDTTQTVATQNGSVLIYGGGAPGTPVAERLEPKSEVFTALTFDASPAATNRRFHQAVILPNKTSTGAQQVLIVGGLDDANNPRADTMLCIPSTAPPAPVCTPHTLVLKTPRAHFAAFVLNNDLVVTGGLGPGNVPVGDTEIYDARSPTLDYVTTVPSLARSHVTATPMSNVSVVISGGQTATDIATAIEIYQPRRAL
jgi:hypothetical protein